MNWRLAILFNGASLSDLAQTTWISGRSVHCIESSLMADEQCCGVLLVMHRKGSKLPKELNPRQESIVGFDRHQHDEHA